MEVAEYSFEVVRDNLRKILEQKPNRRTPEFYTMTVGLICIYARPFTENQPVGRLSEKIVPTEFNELHGNIMEVRHRLFAHVQPAFTIAKDDYPNEVVIENDGVDPRICIARAAVEFRLLERMLPLVDALIEKTKDHRSKLVEKYANAVRNLGKDEFRLNVVDPNGPMFIPLTEDERLVRQRKRSAFTH
jgi:hypothetical protein